MVIDSEPAESVCADLREDHEKRETYQLTTTGQKQCSAAWKAVHVNWPKAASVLRLSQLWTQGLEHTILVEGSGPGCLTARDRSWVPLEAGSSIK